MNQKQTFGIVISTYGTPAFVRLQLESAKRFAPNSPVMVHDDCSGDTELPRLASLYGSKFISTPARMGHCAGDIHSRISGIRRGSELGLDYVIKISRRFVLIKDWVPELIKLTQDQPKTVGASDDAFGWKLRGEFVGMRTPDWLPMLSALDSYKSGHVEEFILEVSKSLGIFKSFPFLGSSRAIDNGNFLWYNFASPERYCDQAKLWGIDGYSPASFNTQPNLQ